MHSLFMTQFSTEALQKFISCNNINRVDGIILFDASVVFYKNNKSHNIESAVQVVKLPFAMAIYIFEFFKEENDQPDMYSTKDFYFNYSDTNTLEISRENMGNPFFLSIMPLKK